MREEFLKQIKEEIIGLKNSPLYSYRLANHYFPVIGEGDHQAKIMLVGEAPGETEARQGRPFCGPAGRILESLIESVELKREQVYITNLVKDRPPNNRDPLPEEIGIYAPFLDRQIEIIQPQTIGTLGRFSMAYLMKKFALEAQLQNISQIHGRVFPVQASYGRVCLVPLFHPAVALYNQSSLKTLREDFQALVRAH